MNTLKQKSFQETQVSFLKCIEHQIFLDTQLQSWGFWGITKVSNLNFKKTSNMPKKRLDAAL